jgi:hypothetical protein
LSLVQLICTSATTVPCSSFFADLADAVAITIAINNLIMSW